MASDVVRLGSLVISVPFDRVMRMRPSSVALSPPASSPLSAVVVTAHRQESHVNRVSQASVILELAKLMVLVTASGKGHIPSSVVPSSAVVLAGVGGAAPGGGEDVTLIGAGEGDAGGAVELVVVLVPGVSWDSRFWMQAEGKVLVSQPLARRLPAAEGWSRSSAPASTPVQPAKKVVTDSMVGLAPRAACRSYVSLGTALNCVKALVASPHKHLSQVNPVAAHPSVTTGSANDS